MDTSVFIVAGFLVALFAAISTAYYYINRPHTKEKRKQLTKKVIYLTIAGTLVVCFFAFSGPLFKKNLKNDTTPRIGIEKIDDAGDIIGGDKITYYNLPPKEEDQKDREKKTTIARVKINRCLQDYSSNIKELMHEYYKESTRIASNMSSKGIGRSGIHIEAQMEHARGTESQIDDLFTKLTRDIEDALLEYSDTHRLSEIPELDEEYKNYDSEKEGIKNLHKKLVDSVQSWEIKIEGKVNITKDFHF